MNAPCLGKRLSSVADLVSENAVLADVGTDHGYLPINLLINGKIKRAVCLDINEGPLKSAERNALEYGVYDKLSFLLSDGLDSLFDTELTDVSICGMGGELILDILSRAISKISGGVSLILQPMSKQSVVRRGLYSMGFEIEKEVYSRDKGKFYLTLLARFTGIKREISDIEAELGLSPFYGELSEAKIGYLKAKHRSLLKTAQGLSKSGKDASDVEMLVKKIEEILNL